MSVQTLMQIQPYLPAPIFNRLVLAAPKAYALSLRIKQISRKRPPKTLTFILSIAALAFVLFLTKAQTQDPSDLKDDRSIQRGWKTQLLFPFWIFGWLLPTESFNN